MFYLKVLTVSWTTLIRKEPSIRGTALWIVLFWLMLSNFRMINFFALKIDCFY
jgi:hypothetical protein